ncbi:MAG TPA: prepilin-type N-terminal cleavage/methylation domain-containing protein [Burkholderiaceae bacterium]|nr:prepilin-type N-terminal cleavage/methylation domain-containing protein [Burkholderiaceae bacterium]HQR71661.1 prepilin-type N-terminal cleavage/methylation domain-containing protein [Burkholderiaceae bacterium]
MRLGAGRNLQRGRTLIELIIAMAIGLVIVAGVASLYMSSSNVSRTANQIGTVEQTGQLALIFIGESVKEAGYGEIIGTDFAGGQNQTLFDGAHLRGCTGQRFTNAFATPPDLSCTGATAGDTLYVRFQARPVVAPMDAAEADRITVTDCLAQAAPTEQIDPTVLRPGAGVSRRMVTNVFFYDPVNLTLNCRGNGGGAAQVVLRDVTDFRVFYRFDDAAYAVGASGVTNAAPLGASVRDATFVNGLAGVIDPWNYVVSVLVCMTIRTNEMGVASTSGAFNNPRCPATAAEAETGLALTGVTTDGRIHRTFSKVFTIRTRATANPSMT